MNPEETPFFRKELTGETHKAEGERVRGKEEWKKEREGRWVEVVGREVLGHNLGTR